MTIWFWLSVLITAGLACAASYWLALWKGRPESASRWGTIALLLPLVLPVLTLWKHRKVGDPPRRVSDTPRHWFIIPLVVLGNLVVLGQVAAVVYDAANDGVVAGLPSCSSNSATSLAKKAIEGSPMGKTLGLAIIDLSSIQEVSSTLAERKCSAMALLNNNTERQALYRMFTRGGTDQWYVSVELAD